MKKHPSAADVLHQKSQVRVLRFLMKNRIEWSGREIARMVGLSAPSTHEALKKLHDRGLVYFRGVSKMHLYKVNEDNYLVRNVFAPLFKAEKAVPNEINKLIKRMLTSDDAQKDRVLSLTIFGSRARGEETLFSDLDLCVIVKDKAGLKAVEDDLHELAGKLYRRFSISLSPYTNTLADFKRKHAGGLAVIKDIRKEGKTLYGKAPRELTS